MQGELLPYRLVEGFTLATKTVEEMAKDVKSARANAGSAAKENL